MSNKTIRVTHQGDKWQVKTDGASKAAKLTDTKADAVQSAIQQAKHQRAELIIQGKDGKIQSKDSYGNDPNPPKDKEH